MVRTPMGKYAKVKTRMKYVIPEHWDVVEPTTGRFYMKDGSLTERAHGLLEIVSKKHAEWYANPINHEYGLLIGTLIKRR